MADVAFGIIGTVAIAIHSARRVKEFIDSIDGAPKVIDCLSADIDALANVLEVLDAEVKSQNFTSSPKHAQIIRLLEQPLQNCLTVLNLLSDKLRPFVKSSGSQGKNKWKSFVWTFREKEFSDIQNLLLSYKSSLDIAISAANLTHTTSGFEEVHIRISELHKRLNVDNASVVDSSFQGSVTTQTDYHFTLKRFLLEANSVVSDLSDRTDDFSGGKYQHENSKIVGQLEINEEPGLIVQPTEVPQPKSDNPIRHSTLQTTNESHKLSVFTSYPCLHQGCLIPHLATAFDSQSGGIISSEVISNIHLWGHQAKYFVHTCSVEKATHGLALHDNEGQRQGELSFLANDVIYICDKADADITLCQGTIAGTTGSFSYDLVASCNLQTGSSFRLHRALCGWSLLPEDISEELFWAVRTSHDNVRLSAICRYIGLLPSGSAVTLMRLVKTLRANLWQSERTETEIATETFRIARNWSGVIACGNAILDRWNSQEKVKYIASRTWQSQLVAYFLEQPGYDEVARAVTDRTKSENKAKNSKKKINSDSGLDEERESSIDRPHVAFQTPFDLMAICEIEGREIPSLVLAATDRIEQNTYPSPTMYDDAKANERILSHLYEHYPVSQTYWRLKDMISQNLECPAVLMFFFRHLKSPVLKVVNGPEGQIVVSRNEHYGLTLDVLIGHLRFLCLFRIVNIHGNQQLATLWAPVLAHTQDHVLKEAVARFIVHLIDTAP